MSKKIHSYYDSDLESTKANRDRLKKNINLMFWYERLYRELFETIDDFANKKILEIGSGASPLKSYMPSVIASDILRLDYLDMVFDCQQISNIKEIPDHSIDVIVAINVLHHLHDPLQFLEGATRKLAHNGQILIVDPYFSLISYPIYKFLHHEPVNFNIAAPTLEIIQGPLSSSNQAIPYMIFFSRPDWLNALNKHYAVEGLEYGFFTSLAYMMTGGISRNFRIPRWFFRFYFFFDHFLARLIPRIFASFFIVRLSIRAPI